MDVNVEGWVGWYLNYQVLLFLKVTMCSRNACYGGVTNDRLRHKQLAAAWREPATRTYMVLPTAAAVRQGCSVVLSACCLLSVICDLT